MAINYIKPKRFKPQEIAAVFAVDPKDVKPVRSGRPSSGKQVVSIRLDPDVIAKFKATGKGWQARMNEALKAAKV